MENSKIITKLEYINMEFNSLLWDLDLNDDQAKKITDLKKYVNEAFENIEHFYCLSDPKFGGIKRCNKQCRGCEHSKNSE